MPVLLPGTTGGDGDVGAVCGWHLTGTLEMHPENGLYGHRAILAEAAGIDSFQPRFRVHVQHGWAPFSPVGHAERLVPSLTYLAWSSSDASKVRSLAVSERVEAVGAPFLYLLRLHGLDKSASVKRPCDRSMLVYPVHSWEREQMSGNHHRYVDEIRERASGPVTICLYWVEFQQPAVRKVYEQAGFRVISHGLRSDPSFLWRQLDEIVRHDVVASNHVSTALWYGGSLGRDVALFGPVFSLYGDSFGRLWARYQSQRWPDFARGTVPGAQAIQLAREELGAVVMRESKELRNVLRPLDGTLGSRHSLVERAVVWGEYTGRRAYAVARSRIRPRAIEARNVQIMEKELDAVPGPVADG